MPYIVFEGGEGSGKSTVWKALQKSFPDAVFVREPGGTPLGEEIRKTILSKEHTPISNAYLFAAARAELISSIVKPALEAGKLVISDRSYVSSMVYQGIVGGLTAEKVLNINKDALQECIPDAVVVFDVSPETSYARTHKRKDEGGELNYFDEKGKEFFLQISQAFKEMGKYGINVKVIDANRSVEECVKSVIEIIQNESA